jgi:hypothetical protein
VRTALTVALVLCAAASAAAQGNGHGNAFGHYKSALSSSAHDGGSAASPLAGTGVRNFGSWLDDATVQDPGGGFFSAGFGLYTTPVYREVDFPSIDSGVGLTPKLQVGMSVPYTYVAPAGAATAHGFGDLYLDAKYQLRAPSTAQTGFALIPMVEVLSVAPPDGGSRTQWALPVSAERQFHEWRAMGTTGYFSRGALFAAGAAEAKLSSRAWLTGSLSWSLSTHHDDLSTALGFHRARLDAGGGVTWAVRSQIAVYGSVGRTISGRDDNSASIVLAAGVSIGVKRPL